MDGYCDNDCNPWNIKEDHICGRRKGDSLFYMIKGDMCLKVVENNTHRDVVIKEGEVYITHRDAVIKEGEVYITHRDVVIKEGEIFLLPCRVAHSPQRQVDTIGMVIERDRAQNEKDGLRYYIEEDGKPTLKSLYEEWFHCEDLGSQLGPIIKRYFASDQHKTGRPV
ncbi:3-hydroxyanthranilate 3,4-dioxygenase-like, partial [Argopecten irradians]|uniref:3-hydroxyanthranilate 3,4-dioxygenase-like n=1 Tax=Argopecten irradians TaxID=31199 RepID=UPI00372170FD